MYLIHLFSGLDTTESFIVIIWLIIAFILGLITGLFLRRKKTEVVYSTLSTTTTPPVEEKLARPIYTETIKEDLKVIEGIGPKIQQIFYDNGITTYKKIINSSEKDLEKILADAGLNTIIHNPKTWPKQAGYADAKQWEELKKYQDHLFGGRDPKDVKSFQE